MQHYTLFGKSESLIPSEYIISLSNVVEKTNTDPVFVAQVRTKLPLFMYRKSKDCSIADSCSDELPAEGDSSSIPLFGRTFYITKINEDVDAEKFRCTLEHYVKSCNPDFDADSSSIEMKAYYGENQYILTTPLGHGWKVKLRKEFLDLRNEGMVGKLIDRILKDFEVKFGHTLTEENSKGEEPLVAFSDKYEQHIGFITSFYRIGKNGYPCKPSRIANFILEWLSVNGIAGIITSPKTNANEYIRRMYKTEPFKKDPSINENATFVTMVDPGKYFNFTVLGKVESELFSYPHEGSPLFEDYDGLPDLNVEIRKHFDNKYWYIIWFYRILRRQFDKINEGGGTFALKENAVKLFLEQVLPNLSFYILSQKGERLLDEVNFGIDSEEFKSEIKVEELIQLDRTFTFITRRLIGLDYITDTLKRVGRTGDKVHIYNIVDQVDRLSSLGTTGRDGYLDTDKTISWLYEQLKSFYVTEQSNLTEEESLITPESTSPKGKGKTTPKESPIFKKYEFKSIRTAIRHFCNFESSKNFLVRPDDFEEWIMSKYRITPPYGLNPVLSGILIYGKRKEETVIPLKIHGLSCLAGTSSKEERELHVKVKIPGYGEENTKTDRAPSHIYPHFDPQRSVKFGGNNIADATLLISAFPRSGHVKSELFNFGVNNIHSCGYLSSEDTTHLVTCLPFVPKESEKTLGYKRAMASFYLHRRNYIRRKTRAIETNKMKRILMTRRKYSLWLQWYKSKVNPKGKMDDLYEIVSNAYYISRSEEVPTTKPMAREIMRMGLLAPENAMTIFKDDRRVPQTYKEIDWICCETTSLIYGRLPAYLLDENFLVFSDMGGDVTSFAKNVNILQGPPSLNSNLGNSIWLSHWKDVGAYDDRNSDVIKKDPFEFISKMCPPSSDSREMDATNVSFYFTSTLGINETDEYAVINLAEFEARSVMSPIRGIDEQKARLRKVWSEISRHGNLSKLPRVKREDLDPWDTPEYLDRIPKGEWNGIRCIFIIGRTSSNSTFISKIMQEEKFTPSNLHWVLMALVTGDVGNDTRQILFYDALLHSKSGFAHENMILAQLILYGIISPDGHTVGSSGFN